MSVNAPFPYGHAPGVPGPAPLARGWVPRLIAGILGVVVALVLVVGSFLSLWTYESRSSGAVAFRTGATSWSFTPDPGTASTTDDGHPARYGIPLSAASVVLLVGSGLTVAACRRAAGRGLRYAAQTVLVAGGGAATAAVWMLAMAESAILDSGYSSGDYSYTYASGAGFWVLLGGGVLAVAVLALGLVAGLRDTSPPAVVPTGPAGAYGPPPWPAPGPPRPSPFAQPPRSAPY